MTTTTDNPTNDAPSTDVARREQPAPGSLSEKIRYAQALAQANLLPRSYVNNPANVLLALELATSLHIAPMTAIQNVHVIEGKPSASSGLISGLVRAAGHRLRVTGDDKEARAEIIRADDPEFVFTSVWTMERAKQAGLTGKAVWKNYPAAMLKARCITEVARDACQDVLLGVAYTPEELGAIVDEEGVPVAGPGQAPARQPAPSASSEDAKPETVTDEQGTTYDPATAEAVENEQQDDVPGTDYWQCLKDAQTVEEVGALWKLAAADGIEDAQLAAAMTARVSAIKAMAEQAPEDDGVVDAEIVEETAPEAGDES